MPILSQKTHIPTHIPPKGAKAVSDTPPPKGIFSTPKPKALLLTPVVVPLGPCWGHGFSHFGVENGVPPKVYLIHLCWEGLFVLSVAALGFNFGTWGPLRGCRSDPLTVKMVLPKGVSDTTLLGGPFRPQCCCIGLQFWSLGAFGRAAGVTLLRLKWYPKRCI